MLISIEALALAAFLTICVDHDGAFGFDSGSDSLDDALAELGSLESRFAMRRQDVLEDIAVQEHSRSIEKLHPSEFFAGSSKPRQRSMNHQVQLVVGDVVFHKIWEYKAVIIGWDEFAKAPQSWIKQHPKYVAHGNKRVPWVTMPNYSVLVVEGGSGAQHDTRYVPQSSIEPLIGAQAKVTSLGLNEYFSGFDDECNRFVPKRWLQQRYPDDTSCTTGHVPSVHRTADL